VPQDSFETVVVDDGSQDGTEAEVSEFRLEASARELSYLRQDHLGPAAARNAGLAISAGSTVVLLGDDTIPVPDFLEQHLRYHAEHNHDGKLAVVGYVTWPTQMRTTPFVRFCGEGGPQFGYASMKAKTPLPYKRFYTSNVSFRRTLVEGLEYVFDEDFIWPMWEDTELGYRLAQRGMVLHYHPDAVAYHEHPTSLAAAYDRYVKIGEVSRMMLKKHPELQSEIHSCRKLRLIHRLTFGLSALVPVADRIDSAGLRLPEALYWLILAAGYARGATRFQDDTRGRQDTRSTSAILREKTRTAFGGSWDCRSCRGETES
jgi:GT2 family glycosyltransferase